MSKSCVCIYNGYLQDHNIIEFYRLKNATLKIPCMQIDSVVTHKYQLFAAQLISVYYYCCYYTVVVYTN